MSAATCANCKFWRIWTVQPVHEKVVPPFGDCRRHAPICHPGTTPSLAKTKWPSTADTDFCGQHRFGGATPTS